MCKSTRWDARTHSVVSMCLRFVAFARCDWNCAGSLEKNANIWKEGSHRIFDATAGEGGLNCGSIGKYRLLHGVSSISNNSGDGRSSV